MTTPPRALSIAGSDSSGGAGIQADLQTFAAHGVWGATAITALTAQNERGVIAVSFPEPEFVVQQIDAVLDEAPVGAAKTGMLGNGAILEAVCGALDRRPIPNLVVDPVLIATSGALLFEPADVELYRRELIPRALLVTPNLPEIRVLAGGAVDSLRDKKRAARTLLAWGVQAVLLKGGHPVTKEDDGDNTLATDLLFDGREMHRLEGPRYEGRSTHGTGCTLSAAIAANLALGRTLLEAVTAAKAYTARCIELGFHWKDGGGLNRLEGERPGKPPTG
jgi:hydroxymethylpyrimidine/phosphomethylpyrimidine kinase